MSECLWIFEKNIQNFEIFWLSCNGFLSGEDMCVITPFINESV